MAKLKTKLIDKINSTNDKELLKEVYRLLEMDFDDQDEVYKLSKEQIDNYVDSIVDDDKYFAISESRASKLRKK